MAGGWTTPELVAAVSEAGGMGMLAAARLTADELRRQIREVRRLTDQTFGVNFQIPTVSGRDDPHREQTVEVLHQIRRRLGLPPAPAAAATSAATVDEGLEIASAASVPVISFAMGSPRPYAPRVHATGAVLMAAATTVDDAKAAEAAGADVIVAQGAEAGGHRSTFEAGPLDSVPLVGTMALLPAVVDAVSIPVVAAGGIMDGRGIVAAFALGAQAVQLGTRFLLAVESGAPPIYRRRLLEADETDTVVTDAFSGRAARGLLNSFIATFRDAGVRPLSWPRQTAAAVDIYQASLEGDGEWAPLLAGQGLRLARREQPAGEIVRELIEDMDRVRRRLP